MHSATPPLLTLFSAGECLTLCDVLHAQVTDVSFTSLNSNSCFQGGYPGKTKDLTSLLPWVTGSATLASQHVSIIELYNQDALLAYDAKYCDPDSVSKVCKSTAGFDTFSGLNTDVTYDFYIKAGQGTPACSGSNCPHAQVINQAHGYH